MDLSKSAKTRRDAVEAALFPLEKLLTDLEECQRRVEAARRVWRETASTLDPVTEKLQALEGELSDWQARLSALWEQGYVRKWNVDK